MDWRDGGRTVYPFGETQRRATAGRKTMSRIVTITLAALAASTVAAYAAEPAAPP